MLGIDILKINEIPNNLPKQGIFIDISNLI